MLLLQVSRMKKGKKGLIACCRSQSDRLSPCPTFLLSQPTPWREGASKLWLSAFFLNSGFFCPHWLLTEKAEKEGGWGIAKKAVAAGGTGTGSLVGFLAQVHMSESWSKSSWRATLLPKWQWMMDGLRSRNQQRHHTKTIRHGEQTLDQEKSTYYMENSQAFNTLRKLYQRTSTGRNSSLRTSLAKFW